MVGEGRGRGVGGGRGLLLDSYDLRGHLGFMIKISRTSYKINCYFWLRCKFFLDSSTSQILQFVLTVALVILGYYFPLWDGFEKVSGAMEQCFVSRYKFKWCCHFKKGDFTKRWIKSKGEIKPLSPVWFLLKV